MTDISDKVVLQTYQEIKSIRGTAAKLGISWQRVTKAVSSQGIIINDNHKKIMDYYTDNKSPEEISNILNLNLNVVKAYLPRVKPERDLLHPSENALRIRKCRERKREVSYVKTKE